MFRSILVPLDGSQFAECAVSYAEALATASGDCTVTLVSVTERVTGFRAIEEPRNPSGQRLAPEARGKLERAATKYLAGVSQRLASRGIKVETEVLFGKPAEEIALYVRHEGIDLVIMSSHGRGGPSRWAMGSVAERVLKSVEVPVMVVRAPSCHGTL